MPVVTLLERFKCLVELSNGGAKVDVHDITCLVPHFRGGGRVYGIIHRYTCAKAVCGMI